MIAAISEWIGSRLQWWHIVIVWVIVASLIAPAVGQLLREMSLQYPPKEDEDD